MPTSVRALHRAGQQIWLDDLSKPLLESGGLVGAIEGLGVTGITSNPAIVARAIRASDAYDAAIAGLAEDGCVGEELLFDLVVSDVQAAAELLHPIWERTSGDDGWVSIQLSPHLSDDMGRSVPAALELHDRVGRPNVLIKMPATLVGLEAIEEVLVAGVPVTMTLLLTPGHVAAAAAAYTRAIERRVDEGRSADVRSYAALYVSRWDAHVPPDAPAGMAGALGIAVAGAAYAASVETFASPRFARLRAAGARPQTLLFASTGGRDPSRSPAHYVERLVATGTANTIPPSALEAFARAGRPVAPLDPGGATARAALGEFAAIGVEVGPIGQNLQREAQEGFRSAWEAVLEDVSVRAAARAPRPG